MGAWILLSVAIIVIIILIIILIDRNAEISALKLDLQNLQTTDVERAKELKNI